MFFCRFYLIQDRNSEHVSLYLKPESGSIDFDVIYDLMILDHVDVSKYRIGRTENGKRLRNEWKCVNSWGEDELISHKELFDKSNHFIKNGKMHFVVAIREDPKTSNVKSLGENSYMDRFKELFKAMTSTDADTVNFLCEDGIQLKALKNVISKKSAVFQAMFQIDMEEKSEGSVNIIDFDSKVMEELLRFLYIGRVESIEEVDIQLYCAANVYMVEGLHEICLESLKSRLSPFNVFEIIEFAHLHEENDLYQHCLQMIYR